MVSPFAKGGSFRFQPFVSGGSKTLQGRIIRLVYPHFGKRRKIIDFESAKR